LYFHKNEYTLGGIRKEYSLTKLFKLLTAATVALFAVGSLTACAPTEAIDMTTIEQVIDVRTPEEFATGHLDGAVNIDIQNAGFAGEIDALDHAANYVIYCRSGNRAGQAVTYMTDAGFTGKLTNAGGVSDAANATGLAIVQ
jgi:rhodanese-related sulfurtransferase